MNEFSVAVEEEGTFGGHTIPTKIRAGSPEPAGEFFRATIDHAEYR